MLERKTEVFQWQKYSGPVQSTWLKNKGQPPVFLDLMPQALHSWILGTFFRSSKRLSGSMRTMSGERFPRTLDWGFVSVIRVSFYLEGDPLDQSEGWVLWIKVSWSIQLSLNPDQCPCRTEEHPHSLMLPALSFTLKMLLIKENNRELVFNTSSQSAEALMCFATRSFRQDTLPWSAAWWRCSDGWPTASFFEPHTGSLKLRQNDRDTATFGQAARCSLLLHTSTISEWWRPGCSSLSAQQDFATFSAVEFWSSLASLLWALEADLLS